MSAVRTITESLPLPSNGVPLITLFSTPTECSTRWFGGIISGAPGVFNYYPLEDKVDTSYFGSYFAKCRPYSTMTAPLSPGVCPSGSEAGNLEFHSVEQVFYAQCCSRYVRGRPDDLSKGQTTHHRFFSSVSCQRSPTSHIQILILFYSGWSWPSSSGGTICSTNFTMPWTAITGYTQSGETYWDSVEQVVETQQSIVEGDSGPTTIILNETTSYVTRKSTTVLSSGLAKSEAIGVWWKTADLRVFPAEYASSLASRIDIPFTMSTTASSGAGASSGTPPPTASPVPELSTSAKIGIAVGAALGGAIAVGAIIITLLWRRRKQRSKDALLTEGEVADPTAKPKLPGYDAVVEADSNAGILRELPGSPNAVNEADGAATVVPEVSGNALNEADAGAGIISEIDSRNSRVIPGSPTELS